MSFATRTGFCAAFLLAVYSAVLPAARDKGLEKVTEYLGAGDTLAAIYCLEHADLEGTRDPRWFILLGRLHRSRGTIVDRVKSQYVLERAVQLFPENPAVLQEMGLTYFSRTFYPDAARSFKRALEIDPGLCETRYKLGVTYYERWKLRVNAFFDDADEARAWLESAVGCDSSRCDAAVRYVNVLYALACDAEASDNSMIFARRFPAAPEFPLMIGVVAYERNQAALADSAFRAAVALMNEGEKAAYTSLHRNVLGYDDLAVYERAGEDERAVMNRAFWINGDPDPTNDLNERFLEHVYRTYRADLFFSHSRVHAAWTKPQIRGWNTERGEISIKFGWPDKIYATYGGDRQEHWTYVNGFDEHTFVFTDRFLNGNLQIPPDRSEKLVYARHENRVTTFKPLAALINGAMDVVVFKDDDLNASVYVAAQINADSVLNTVDLASFRRWHARTRFFDTSWNEAHATAETLGVADLPLVDGTQYRLFDVVSRHRMPFDDYLTAFAFEDDRKTVLAVFTGQSDGSRMIGDALALSDVLLLREGTTGASFVRRDELLLANPWKTYQTGQPLRAYFEIYNLSVTGGESRYRITYEIRDHPERPLNSWNKLGRWMAGVVGTRDGDPHVAQSYTRAGYGHDESEKISIDIDVLKGGRYRLIITVEDLNSGETAAVDKTFYKAGTAGRGSSPPSG